MKSKFIHLHTHSHFSLLQALPKIKDLVEAAKKSDMKALALTDNGNLYGAIEFYKKCKEADIKPIIGVDFYVALRTRNDKEAGIDNKRHRLILLAKGANGYKNLIKLVTVSHLEGFYYKPRIDRELIGEYSDDLIAIMPSFSGEVASALRVNDEAKALDIVHEYQKYFAEEDFYLEITHHPEISRHGELQKKIIELSEESGAPLVAAHDVYYINKEDRKARDTLLSIQTGADITERGGFTDEDEDFSFIGQEDAERFFKDNKEALDNSVKIADKCNVEIELGRWIFPEPPLGEGKNYDDELKRLSYEGLKNKNLDDDETAKKRINYELGVIRQKGYSSYFLVVGDLMKFSNANGILYNIRGSVSGSLVTYALGITKINPLEYDIPFERFLNPDRPSPPDIDMDFADDRRDEVIEYAKSIYGADKVAQIGTFGTMLARGAVRDVARALGYEYSAGDRIAKMIPFPRQGFPVWIDNAIEEVRELKEAYRKEPETREILDMARKIEGLARHISVHAAGVVISPEPLSEHVPLQYDPKEKGIITQYSMYDIEDIGLVKFDFLGLKNLAILADVVRIVKKTRGLDIDVDKIPLDDKKTFEMLSRGETMGLFQLNGAGMTRFLKDLKPTSINDINAMVALYRPGPMQFIPEYIKRKHNPRLVKFPAQEIEEILKPTYGILVYQDDLLTMARRLAGYSWLEVDKFRKAVGKKIPKLMAEQKDKFIKGCIETVGWSEEKSTEIWNWIEPFAAYGFNKAHSVSYGRVAYETAYMKANFPTEYMSAVLSADAGDIEKISEIISECGRMGIAVLPPDVNESFGDFAVLKSEGDVPERGGIRFGLYSIKNFGKGVADSIIAERLKNGRYKSTEDFLSRITDKNLNKKSLEALIMSGAMDGIEKRGRLLGNLESLLSFNKELNNRPDNQDSLFAVLGKSGDLPGLRLEEAEEPEMLLKLKWERELLGLYVSGHPLDQYKERLNGKGESTKLAKERLREGMLAGVSGLVESIRAATTRSGEPMAFMRVSDYAGSIEVVVFPKKYEALKEMLAEEICVHLEGRVSKRSGETSIILETCKRL